MQHIFPPPEIAKKSKTLFILLFFLKINNQMSTTQAPSAHAKQAGKIFSL